jgi:hypothetical protein
MTMTFRGLAAACALAFGATAFGAPAVPRAEAAPLPPLPPGCVATLHDVHAGSGAKSFASHYVTDGIYGYGEFSAGGLGGQSLWRRNGAAWCRVPTGGAVLDRATIAAFGVPPAVADRLIALMKARPEVAPPKPLPTLPPFGSHHR